MTLVTDTATALALQNLGQPPDGMMAIELPDGWRVFAPAGNDPVCGTSVRRERRDCIMMIVAAGVKVHLVLGHTDMTKGLDGLAMLVQAMLKQDPFSGHLFAFRGKKAWLLKILFWDGNGLCVASYDRL
ncbi:IS66 family insertion sequence element accessory protein TnpB [Aminobacter ciceronei]|uniref:IS66 family insertion sequence element accessory protein TnpB n=1 Tax=Aminobacter ciceronei TaxID=150723 RepID=UPI0028AD7679|nr:IS66 family insertion sequence element accessory protein TnpB [Aminobacter ciceronei]